MKTRIIITLLLLFTVTSTTIFFACQKKDDTTKFSSDIKVLYKRNDLKAEFIPSIYADHVDLVELLGYNNSFCDSLKTNPTWLEIIDEYSGRIKLDSIRRVSYDYNQLQVLMIPIADSASGNKLYIVVYVFQNHFLCAKAKLLKVNDKITEFQLASNSDEIYFKFQVTPDLRVGNFDYVMTPPFSKVFPRIVALPNPGGGGIGTMSTPCPQQGLPYGQCMLCAAKECSEDWVCMIVCGFDFELCAVAWSLACLFGGND